MKTKRHNPLERLLARGVIHRKDGEDGDSGGASGDDTVVGGDADDTLEGAGKDDKGSTKPKDGDGKDKKPSDAVSEEMAKLLKDVMKQKGRAKDAESKVSELAGELGKIKEVLGDSDLETIRELVKGAKDAQRKQMEAKGQYEQIVEQMRQEHQNGVKSLETKANELADRLAQAQSQVMELTIGRAFADSNFIRENSVLPHTIARREFGAYFDIGEDGEIVAYNKPRGAAGRAPLVDANGSGKSFEAAIATLYEQHTDSKSLLRTKQKPGSGSGTQQPAGGTGAQKTGATEEKLSGRERILKALNGTGR